jgi:NAD(P)-dependent dehydrogenase (short-subunit alcohol dehydrogenase family)
MGPMGGSRCGALSVAIARQAYPAPRQIPEKVKCSPYLAYRVDVAETARHTTVITGGASGIGLATARRLSDRGHAVAILDRDEQALAAAAAHVPRAWRFAVDVADGEGVERAVSEIERDLGPVDGLVNSAGVSSRGEFLALEVPEVRRVFEVNVIGTLVVSQAVARRMCARRTGAIVNLASVAGLRGSPGRTAYGVSKAGVALLTKTMALELASHGVRVNAVAPGAIETPLVERIHTAADRERYTATIPLGRYGRPEEVAAAIAFALDERQAAYLTGAVIELDGGLAATR